MNIFPLMGCPSLQIVGETITLIYDWQWCLLLLIHINNIIENKLATSYYTKLLSKGLSLLCHENTCIRFIQAHTI